LTEISAAYFRRFFRLYVSHAVHAPFKAPFKIKKALLLASIAPSEVYTWQGKKLSALRYFLQTPKFER